MPGMSGTFRDALLWHMDRHQTTLAELAKGSGVSIDTIKKVRSRDGASTKAAPAEKIAAYYGKSVTEFLRCQDNNNQADRLLSLIDLLTPEEAALVARQVQGILASRGT